MKRHALTVGTVLAVFWAGAACAREPRPTLADVAYGPDPKQQFDVYAPPDAHGAPVIVMVHGGGWRIGDKSNRGVVGAKGEHWLAKGYVFVSVNYRLLPHADPLTQARDVAAALAMIENDAGGWGGDPGKVVLMGHSAGAHLVGLLSADPALAAQAGAAPWAGTVVLDSAAMDVAAVMSRKHYDLYDDAFGADTSYWKTVSPIAQLTAAAPPMLLVCSNVRPDKPCVQAHAFAQKAAPLGVRVQVSEQALSHREVNVSLGKPGAYTDTVDAFITALTR